jgi:hypothetical protein
MHITGTCRTLLCRKAPQSAGETTGSQPVSEYAPVSLSAGVAGGNSSSGVSLDAAAPQRGAPQISAMEVCMLSLEVGL